MSDETALAPPRSFTTKFAGSFSMGANMRFSHNECQLPHNQKYEDFASALLTKVMQNSPMNEKEARIQIANWLRDAIELRNMTQIEFAREVRKLKINLDQSKTSRILKLVRSMTAQEILAATEVLKVPLPFLFATKPEISIAGTSEENSDGYHPDLSELALEITKDLEKNESKAPLSDEEYIEASALIYNMLRSTDRWHPDLFEASKRMMSKVKADRKLSELTFTDYVKSVAIYYRTLADAEKNSS